MKSLIIIFTLGFISQLSVGCTCTGHPEYATEMSIEWVNNSRYVVVAVIDSVLPYPDSTHSSGDWALLPDYGELIYATVIVDYKNDGLKNITFTTPLYRTSCEDSYKDRIGFECVLFLNINKYGRMETHFCNGGAERYPLNHPMRKSVNKTDSLTVNGYDKYFKKMVRFLDSIKNNKTGKFYYTTGNLMAKGKLVNGQPEGEWIYYTQTNSLVAKGNYLNGKKEGIWLEKWYVEGGNEKHKFTLDLIQESEIVYHQGEITGKKSKYTLK